MKRKLIRNPVLRWFAGLGVLIAWVVPIFVAVYWIGRLAMSLWAKTGMVLFPMSILDYIVLGIFSLFALGTVVAIFYTVKATGDEYFDQSAESQKIDPQPAAS